MFHTPLHFFTLPSLHFLEICLIMNFVCPSRSGIVSKWLIGRNVMFLSSRHHFSVADFHCGQASRLTNTISCHHRDTVSDTDLSTYMLLTLQQNYCVCEIVLTDDVVFTKDELNDLLLTALSTLRLAFCTQF